MPELTFTTRWPDGRSLETYSPSLVVHDHLEEGRSYTVEEFARRSVVALGAASERVRERWGSACSSAGATVEQICRSAGYYAATDVVEVVALHPPAPARPRRRCRR